MSTPARHGKRGLLATFTLIGIVLALAGCAANAPPATVTVAAPPQWYASLPKTVSASPAATPANSLPHNGSLTSLSLWWQQQNDTLLVDMISAAQIVSPSVITARSNIQQAQASRIASAAALLPTLDAVGNASRSVSAPLNRNTRAPINNAALLGLQTSWEIDLFGQNQASLNADSERLLGSEALWHEARILVAAEVASQYYSLRACEQLLGVTSADAKSRFETSRLTDLLTKAGFGAPATAALAPQGWGPARDRESDWTGLAIDGARLVLTDGRCAHECAAHSGHADTAVFDRLLHWPVAPGAALAYSVNRSASARWHAEAPAWLMALGLTPLAVSDSPGLVVARTVAMLVNEAADAVLQGVCSERGADAAMKLGVNYPAGPFEWLQAWGAPGVLAVLDALDAHYRGERYRASPWLRR